MKLIFMALTLVAIMTIGSCTNQPGRVVREVTVIAQIGSIVKAEDGGGYDKVYLTGWLDGNTIHATSPNNLMPGKIYILRITDKSEGWFAVTYLKSYTEVQP